MSISRLKAWLGLRLRLRLGDMDTKAILLCCYPVESYTMSDPTFRLVAARFFFVNRVVHTRNSFQMRWFCGGGVSTCPGYRGRGPPLPEVTPPLASQFLRIKLLLLLGTANFRSHLYR